MTDRTNWAEVDLSALHVRFGERPHMPAMPGATEDHRRQGRKLAAIHRAHLMDMRRIARLLAAIKGGPEPGSNFDVSGNLTEIVLLGVLAERFNTRIEWDAKAGKVTNKPELNAFVREPAREGWDLGEYLWKS